MKTFEEIFNETAISFGYRRQELTTSARYHFAANNFGKYMYEEGLKADRWIMIAEHGDPVSHTPFLVLEADGTQSVDQIVWNSMKRLDWSKTTPIAYQPLPSLPSDKVTDNKSESKDN